MSRADQRTPVSPGFDQLYNRRGVFRKIPVNKRIVYLSIQAVINAVAIGLLARVLVGLIMLITNIAFYGRVSFAYASPADNHLGWMVLAIPVAGIIAIIARDVWDHRRGRPKSEPTVGEDSVPTSGTDA